MKPWTIAGKPEKIDIVAPEGEIRSSVLAYFAGNLFVIEDMSVDIQAGDEIRRPLPNGKEQAFTVTDPACYPSGPFAPHYQVKIAPKGTFDQHKGGHYQVTVSGPNSRVNIGSHDSSVNVAISDNVFNDIRHALANAGIGSGELAILQKKVAAMEAAEDQGTFSKAYQGFVGGLANHITVVAPFLPALTQMLSALPA